MAKLLEMPKLSPTMEEGQISAWHKKVGDVVKVDDLLAEVETDKATMEYRSFDAGTLLAILAPAGAVVKLGQPVAVVGKPGEDTSALVGASGGAGAPSEARSQGAPASAAAPAPSAPAEPVAPDPSGRVKASPYVRKVARDKGLDLHGVTGSGPGGRIVARDLEGTAPSAPRLAPPPPASAGYGGSSPAHAPGDGAPDGFDERPLSMMRKTIARRLVESKQTVPHFYLTIDVDADALADLREQVVADLAAMEPTAPKVSVNDLLVRAVALALRRVPEANAQFTPDAIRVHRGVHVSVAVAVADGLVTPVVRDADRKSVLAISREIRELAERARNKKLRPEEMTGGTFSISNLGMYGIDAFAAVINPPEGAILAVGQIRKEPVVRGEQVVVGRKLAMTLSCDHRVIDGAVGATFLKALRALLEHPTQILVA